MATDLKQMSSLRINFCFCPILNKVRMRKHFFKNPNIKFQENLPDVSKSDTCGLKDKNDELNSLFS
jgi:hypothetical protein